MLQNASGHNEILQELNGLQEEEIKEVIDFIGYLKEKKKRQIRITEKEDEDLLSVCGIVDGPDDLSEQHNHYLYGWEKK